MRFTVKSVCAALALSSLASAPAFAITANTYEFGGSDFTSFAPVLTINGGTSFNAINAGRYGDVNGYDSTNPNYIVGNLTFDLDALHFSENYNNFFVFDLSNLSGPITSASLSLVNPSGGFNGTSAIYTNYDVSTDSATLSTSHLATPAIFADLGSGNAYASTTVDASTNGTTLEIALNAQALADITAAEGHNFSIGGTLTDAVANAPLPAALPMFGAAVAGLFAARRSKRAG